MAALLLSTELAAGPPLEASRNAFALSSDEECWRKLPPTEKGGGQALPSWARALADPMPRTTAALLRLDLVQRTRSPLDPKLRAQMRWVAAHIDRCDYSRGLCPLRRPPRRPGRCCDRGPAQRRRFSEAVRGESRPGVRPQDDRRTGRRHRRRVRGPGRGVRRTEGRGDGPADGLRQFPGPAPALPRLRRSSRAGRCRRSRWYSHPRRSPPRWSRRRPARLRRCPGRPGRTSSRTAPNGPSLTYEQLQARLEEQSGRPTRLRIPNWEEVELACRRAS